MKKAVEKVNKHILNGRPLKVKEVEHTWHIDVAVQREAPTRRPIMDSRRIFADFANQNVLRIFPPRIPTV